MNLLNRKKRRGSKILLPFDKYISGDASTAEEASPLDAFLTVGGLVSFSLFSSSFTSVKSDETFRFPERTLNAGELPDDVQERVDKLINTGRAKKSNFDRNLTDDTLKRFEAQQELITGEFVKQDIPLNLANLTIIETNAKPSLKSSAGALGPWQIMPTTGKGLGLNVLEDFNDWKKSTHAAAVYLKGLYKQFGSADMAVMAYNCGPGNLNKAIKKAGYQVNKKDWNQREIWDVWHHVPIETQGYYIAWLRMNEKHNLEQSTTVTTEYEVHTHHYKSITASPHNKK